MNVGDDMRLLPNYFKKIAVGVIGITILFVVLTVLKVFPFDKYLMLRISGRILILGLLILALSRDKNEDELISKIRLKALALSFLITAVLVIMRPLLNLIFDRPYSWSDGPVFLILKIFLIYHFVFFYFWKKKR